MEARNFFMSIDLTKLPDPPMSSYSFTLFSRYLFEKSKFKDYYSLLESKLSRSQARVSHLTSILENGNSIGANETLTRTHVENESKSAHVMAPRTTSTYYVCPGDYVASFTIGTEQARTYLIIDTGSDLVWWQCRPCTRGGCYDQNDSLYVSTNSVTYEKLNCNARPESYFTSNRIKCKQDSGACVYDVVYEDGSETKGWIAEDAITFVLDQNQQRILFGCGKNQMSGERSFSPEYSGIAGIGRRLLTGGYSLPSQFEADIMAMCLPGIDSDGSTISFHTTPFKKTVSTELLPNPAKPIFYFVNLYKVFINNKEITLSPSIRNFRNVIADGVMVDTVKTLSYFPQTFYNVFRDTFRQEVKEIPLINAQIPGRLDTCYLVDPGVVPNFLVVKMYFSHQDRTICCY
ncbi:protein ASPARTIC PROTEASE IN GUARD CELL 1-like [Capsicum annuum]|uniref:protein ASPARTIC PROTEASE IN GUARD CELL 1-like n=1 Tax=Capsicum annuum TaxID=4072 RepID=UPI0007BF6CFB|nr:protein ASPARTIC PROTEASE IN GUARD CELL 1-like [Capsicum annuum]